MSLRITKFPIMCTEIFRMDLHTVVRATAVLEPEEEGGFQGERGMLADYDRRIVELRDQEPPKHTPAH